MCPKAEGPHELSGRERMSKRMAAKLAERKRIKKIALAFSLAFRELGLTNPDGTQA